MLQTFASDAYRYVYYTAWRKRHSQLLDSACYLLQAPQPVTACHLFPSDRKTKGRPPDLPFRKQKQLGHFHIFHLVHRFDLLQHFSNCSSVLGQFLDGALCDLEANHGLDQLGLVRIWDVGDLGDSIG